MVEAVAAGADAAFGVPGFVAAGVDDADLFFAFFAEIAFGDANPLVEADLGEFGGGVCGFLAPAPDLRGVDVDEIGATSQGYFVAEGEDAGVGGEVDEDGAVAVGKTTYEGAAGVFVEAGAEAVDVFAEVVPVGSPSTVMGRRRTIPAAFSMRRRVKGLRTLR